MKETLVKMLLPFILNMIGEVLTADRVRGWIKEGCEYARAHAAETDNTIDDAFANELCDILEEVCGIE